MSLSRRNSRMKRVAAAFAATILLFLLPQTVGAAPAARPTSSADLVHIVRPGDTLANLAATYGVSVEEIRAYNNLHNRAELGKLRSEQRQHAGAGYRAAQWRARSAAIGWSSAGGPTRPWLPGQSPGMQSSPGFYSHILDGGGPREGNWWVWIENEAGQRISEAGFVPYRPAAPHREVPAGRDRFRHPGSGSDLRWAQAECSGVTADGRRAVPGPPQPPNITGTSSDKGRPLTTLQPPMELQPRS